MTTDPFAEAARAEAERRHFPQYGGPSVISAVAVQGFVDGAEWARTHLAQQNPLTEAIRAVATTAAYTGQDITAVGSALAKVMDPEPTDAEVEAAANAICSGEGGCDPCFNWDDSVDGGCTYCTRHARAALSAARAARRDEEKRDG